MELKIKEILKSKGLTSAQLAERIGITKGALSNSINKNPTLSTLEKIAEALDVQVVDLFENKTTTANCPHCGKPISIELK
jgi:transcriptional regulator with XRE-family HTH domain